VTVKIVEHNPLFWGLIDAGAATDDHNSSGSVGDKSEQASNQKEVSYVVNKKLKL
jgi:hypothetical protein